MTFPLSRHPGGIIRRRYIESKEMTVTEMASAMGVSISSVSRFINEKSELTADMALRLSAAIGGNPEDWLTMQMHHSLAQAKAKFSGIGQGECLDLYDAETAEN